MLKEHGPKLQKVFLIMNKVLLEVAVFTLNGALAAIDAGADRLELCENAHDGGTTPSKSTLDFIHAHSPIPVFPIIRARGGDFVYSEQEKKVMLADIMYCRSRGFKGVVSGGLLRNGQVDTDFLMRCRDAAGTMEFTFHRAFDRCLNPLESMELIIAHGVKRILSSGQYPVLPDGIPLLKKMVEQAGNRLIVLPGSGLTQHTVVQVVKETGVKEVHTSARKSMQDPTTFQPATFPESMSYTGVDVQEIKAIQALLATCE
jgi:copper homeostasis protein